MLQGDAKWGALYSCEAFILPSHQKNFGIAIAEALACVIPVLMTKKVNIWREIEDDGAAIICNDNLEGILKILSEWLNLPTEKTRVMSAQMHFLFCAAIQYSPNGQIDGKFAIA